MWPDLAKFCHFGKKLQVFGKFLKVYFLFGKMLSILWQICDIFGLNFLFAIGQILKNYLTIWSHCWYFYPAITIWTFIAHLYKASIKNAISQTNCACKQALIPSRKAPTDQRWNWRVLVGRDWCVAAGLAILELWFPLHNYFNTHLPFWLGKKSIQCYSKTH